MSNNDKQQTAPPKAIPVRELHFRTKCMLPSGNLSDVVQSTTQVNKPRFTIEYIPATQFYRVAYYAPSATEPTKVMMYPREWAAFEPGAM